MAGEKKQKPRTIQLLDAESGESKWLLRELNAMVSKYHGHLREAVIRVVFKTNWSEDNDGKTPLGKMSLVPELYWRLLGGDEDLESPAPDFVMLLNDKLWGKQDEPQRRYVLDELLSYAKPKLDKDGEQAEDITGRRLWALSKAEFSGFAAPLARHGAQTKSTKRFVKEVERSAQKTIFEEEPAAAPAPKPDAAEATH